MAGEIKYFEEQKGNDGIHLKGEARPIISFNLLKIFNWFKEKKENVGTDKKGS